METSSFSKHIQQLFLLLRWNKPSGRLILLIPAGWSLWMTPNSPPSARLVFLIIAGGLFTSGAGCIANDLWDRHIDKHVNRTKDRPLASGEIKPKTAVIILIVMLLLSLLIVIFLPVENKQLCLYLAIIALLPILIYPSAKRWFKYPQAFLAICWGFSVLIPWAASQSSLAGGVPLFGAWGATLMWTFGFDTVYAMADQEDDKKLGLHSSALSLKTNAKRTVANSYGLACILLASAALASKINWTFWPIFLLASCGMQREVFILNNDTPSRYSRHFENQVKLGSLLLLGLIIGRIS